LFVCLFVCLYVCIPTYDLDVHLLVQVKTFKIIYRHFYKISVMDYRYEIIQNTDKTDAEINSTAWISG